MYVQPGYNQPMMQPMGQPMMQPMMTPVMTPVQPVMGVQPVYPYMAPQQPQNNAPIIIKLDGGSKKDLSYCQFCQQQTDQVPRKKIGCVAIAWGFFYFAFTGVCCIYPCLVDRYKDTELVCMKCQQVKATIPASCC